jgi:hypothetical protein
MLNIGKSNEESSNVYIGCEGMIILEKVQKFIDLIKTI